LDPHALSGNVPALQLASGILAVLLIMVVPLARSAGDEAAA